MTNNRKPAHLEYSGGKSPRQRIWEKIRELKQFTLNELAGSLPGSIHRDTTRTYVKSLTAAGILNAGPYANTYALAKDNGVEAPRVRKDGSYVTVGHKQENLWRTLRTIHHAVGYFELSALASTEAHPVTPEFARDYLNNLFLAGYMNKESNKYRLKPSMSTGPRPPMIQRIKQVYDPNLGKVVWTETKGEDDE